MFRTAQVCGTGGLGCQQATDWVWASGHSHGALSIYLTANGSTNRAQSSLLMLRTYTWWAATSEADACARMAH